MSASRGGARRLLPLSRGISDQTIQRAVLQLESAADRLTTGIVVTGSKGGNAALASLISALEQLNLITDKTT